MSQGWRPGTDPDELPAAVTYFVGSTPAGLVAELSLADPGFDEDAARALLAAEVPVIAEVVAEVEPTGDGSLTWFRVALHRVPTAVAGGPAPGELSPGWTIPGYAPPDWPRLPAAELVRFALRDLGQA